MSEHRFGRLITAMITPFKENLDLDLDRTEELADRLVKGGTDSIIVCGTTGESPTVFYPQKIEVIKAVVRAVDGRIPVIANVGDNCTAKEYGIKDEDILGVMTGFIRDGKEYHVSDMPYRAYTCLWLHTIPLRVFLKKTKSFLGKMKSIL